MYTLMYREVDTLKRWGLLCEHCCNLLRTWSCWLAYPWSVMYGGPNLRHSMLVFYSNGLCKRVGPKGNSFQRWIRSRARA